MPLKIHPGKGNRTTRNAGREQGRRIPERQTERLRKSPEDIALPWKQAPRGWGTGAAAGKTRAPRHPHAAGSGGSFSGGLAGQGPMVPESHCTALLTPGQLPHLGGQPRGSRCPPLQCGCGCTHRWTSSRTCGGTLGRGQGGGGPLLCGAVRVWIKYPPPAPAHEMLRAASPSQMEGPDAEDFLRKCYPFRFCVLTEISTANKRRGNDVMAPGCGHSHGSQQSALG